jgi:hypothetical protein
MGFSSGFKGLIQIVNVECMSRIHVTLDTVLTYF